MSFCHNICCLSLSYLFCCFLVYFVSAGCKFCESRSPLTHHSYIAVFRTELGILQVLKKYLLTEKMWLEKASCSLFPSRLLFLFLSDKLRMAWTHSNCSHWVIVTVMCLMWSVSFTSFWGLSWPSITHSHVFIYLSIHHLHHKCAKHEARWRKRRMDKIKTLN